MIEKTQDNCFIQDPVSLCLNLDIGMEDGHKTYLDKPSIESGPEYEHHDRGANRGYPQAQTAEFPRRLAFSGPCIDEKHQEQNIDRRQHVEGFKGRVPDGHCEVSEEVCVSGEEDDGVEGLC
jgi:hypothetical protein